jgi:hypothetical protein
LIFKEVYFLFIASDIIHTKRTVPIKLHINGISIDLLNLKIRKSGKCRTTEIIFPMKAPIRPIMIVMKQPFLDKPTIAELIAPIIKAITINAISLMRKATKSIFLLLKIIKFTY